MPSASIPYGQRNIVLYMQSANKLVKKAPSVFQKTIVTTLYYPAGTFAAGSTTFDLTDIAIDVNDNDYDPSNPVVHVLPTHVSTETFLQPRYAVKYVEGDTPINYPVITKSQLLVNNIFTIPEIHDMYIKNLGFYLIRLHVNQTETI
jgi:hypothetical protein